MASQYLPGGHSIPGYPSSQCPSIPSISTLVSIQCYTTTYKTRFKKASSCVGAGAFETEAKLEQCIYISSKKITLLWRRRWRHHIKLLVDVGLGMDLVASPVEWHLSLCVVSITGPLLGPFGGAFVFQLNFFVFLTLFLSSSFTLQCEQT